MYLRSHSSGSMFSSLVRYAGGVSQFCGMTLEWRGQFSVETRVDSGLISTAGQVTPTKQLEAVSLVCLVPLSCMSV